MFPVFNNSHWACSWSPFNTYFILQALGNMGNGGTGADANNMEYAVALTRLCWGSQLTLVGAPEEEEKRRKQIEKEGFLAAVSGNYFPPNGRRS